MARETTGTLGRPVLRALQALPPSVLLNTPSRSTPAYMVVGVWGSMARALTEGRVVGGVVVAALQPPAPLVLMTTPQPAASTASGVGGSVARARTAGVVRAV